MRRWKSASSVSSDGEDAQILQFEQLRQAARQPVDAQIREKDIQRLELLNSGTGADSPVIVHLIEDISKLQRQASDARSHRDQAMALLNDAQKTKFAALETALELVREGIEVGLIVRPPRGEPLCN